MQDLYALSYGLSATALKLQHQEYILVTSALTKSVFNRFCCRSHLANKVLHFVLAVCLVFASNQAFAKDKLRTEDFSKWHTLIPESISGNGEWLSYRQAYDHDNTKNALYIKKTFSNDAHEFIGGTSGKFSPDSRWYAYQTQSGGVGVLNTSNGGTTLFPYAETFAFSGNSEAIIIHMGKIVGESVRARQLIVLSLKRGKMKAVDNVESYKVHESMSALAYVVEKEDGYAVEIMQLSGAWEVKTVLQEKGAEYSSLVWDSDGKNIAFMKELGQKNAIDKTYLVYYYEHSGTASKLYSFDYGIREDVPRGMKVSKSRHRPVIGIRGEAVLFEISPDNKMPNPEVARDQPSVASSVQVWHYKDEKVVSDVRRAAIKVQLSAWWPRNNTFVQLETDGQSLVAFSNDNEYALTVDATKYLPQFKYKASFRDVYLVDTANGMRKRVIENQHADYNGSLVVSPTGKYISYFKGDAWWVYDTETSTHTNVSQSIGFPVHDVRHDDAGLARSYGSPGWTVNDKEILIYDQFDIWSVSIDGVSARRLTSGRNEDTINRIYQPLYANYELGSIYSSGYNGRTFDLSDGVVISSFGDKTKKSEFSILGTELANITIVSEDMRVDRLLKAKNQNVYAYQQQRFDTPPEIVAVDIDNSKRSTVVRSNPQHDNYLWGKAETVNYVTKGGRELQGSLFYPANYDPRKKYPMIVYIYERQSDEVHQYINPSEATYLSYSNYTSDGYFVFLPDIAYDLNMPGFSALECVTAGVERVLELASVDPRAVGLTGHSWGGYETAFIITQTDIFAAAVAGAAATDLVNLYLDTEPGSGVPTMWRFENQQLRFAGPLHENYEAYIRNSPIYNAAALKTPLLSWFGTEDPQLDWNQGVAMYNLLRRMEKEHVLLAYPGEGHIVIRNRRNAIDLQNRIAEWFSYYLKKRAPADWIIKGVQPH